MPDIQNLNSSAVAQKLTNGELAGRWNIDAARSTVTIATKAMFGLVPVKGSFTSFEGYGEVGASGDVSGQLTIDAASITTKNNKRDTHLRSADFFTVDRFPTITFQLDRLVTTAAGSTAEGSLTVLSTTKSVTAPASIELVDSGEVVLDVTLDIDRSEYGLTWAKMGAGLKNAVALHLSFRHA